ncbi:MAG: nicotinate (nicotinamide) nucleotide adenylyltransferase [Chloroflexi bacterium]|nr:MAG: nicotinate (nicotinamide) nucleotide adenylyltransferase [Chloroflexota bacterium]PIE82431.1 MAG: nicotinate (nicotinamide) nucleotide adenylyltransferase [Chloroflexota bacterium]
MMKQRIGLLGGTFDPPHMGHLWLAEAARDQLLLDKVLFLPVGEPPHKQEREITAVSHRLTMLQHTITNNPAFAIDTTDMERPPPHTTVTLIPRLQRAYPQATFWLIMGADSLVNLPHWVEPGQIIQQCRLAVLPRPGFEIDWLALETAVPGVTQVVDMLEGPSINISSTGIRAWAKRGRSLNYLVATAVLPYIKQQKLYSSSAVG